MSRKAPVIEVTPEERLILESWNRSGKIEQRMAFRGKIILAASEGQESTMIARDLHTTVSTVGKWRQRFRGSRMNGLADASRPGVTPKYDTVALEKRVLEMLDKPAPKGYASWTGPLLAQALGEVSEHKVWRILRQLNISLTSRHSWCVSTDPEFVPKAAAITRIVPVSTR